MSSALAQHDPDARPGCREQHVRLARLAADRLLSYPWKLWFWGDSIGLEGLLDASELTGDARYSGYVYGLLKGWLARESQRSEFDYTAAGAALLRVYEQTRDPALLEAARRHAAYMAGFRKTDRGAYVRYEKAALELAPVLPPDHPDYRRASRQGSCAGDGGPCVFVDSIHFDGPFFAKLHQVTGEDRYRRLALENILPQVELLFDEEQGLFHHFWIERTRSRNGVLWGRGNGWGLLGIVHTLEHLPEGDRGARPLLDVLGKLAGRLAGLQDPSGGWRTVLDDPESYVETSIAAFVADGCALAIRRGWLSAAAYRPMVESAMQFVLSRIRPDGVLDGVSYETFPSTRLEHYRRIPRNAVAPWGQGPLLTALYSHSLLRDPG